MKKLKVNPYRLKKDELIDRLNFSCVHRHNGLSHPMCYEENKKLTEHIGYLDIETTGLNANWDYIISYAILDNLGNTYGRVLTDAEVRDWKVLDKDLMREFLDIVKDFDRLVVYWGKDRRHDIPFLRTRCLKHWAEFPEYKKLSVTDCYDIARNKLRLNRNRLQNVCDFLKVPSKEHRLDSEEWQKAKLGCKKSLEYVWLHNMEDVVSLKLVYEKLNGFTANRKVSI